MRRVRVTNVTRSIVLAEAALLADNAWTRMRGLLGRPQPGIGEGLVLRPCNQVHTVGMGYPIDVAYVAEAGLVLRVIPGLQPMSLTWPCLGAHWTVELAPGGLGPTTVGDLLDFTVVPDRLYSMET
jgi:hypothetical protein